MGIWDVIYPVGDGVKGISPDLSTVKRAGNAAYSCTAAACIKIDQVVRVDGIQKLPQYWPDGETRAQITLFATTLARNSAKYAVYEGFKHIPGGTVASKLVSDTIREVKGQNQKDVMKAKVNKIEEDVRRLAQQESLNENRKLSSQNAGGGGNENANDVINVFMKTEFVGNQMFRDLMVPKYKKNE